jgi:hypothetical protein
LEVGAADITDLQVLSKDASTLEFLFQVSNLSGGPSSAIVGTNHAGATWMVTWHQNDDFWFAAANASATGTSCLAGRPTPTFTSGGPKSLEYIPSTEATAVSGCVFNNGANTIEIDVPLADIGNPANGSLLYGLTGFTGDLLTSANISTVDGIPIAFFDNIDQTAPIDAKVGAGPGTPTPEVPAVPLLVGLGALAALGGYVYRRRGNRLRAA